MTEKSPHFASSRLSRLHMGKRPGRQSDSPKITGRLSDSPASPLASVYAADGPCNTPKNSRKRTCFGEESPSQDYDISMAFMSQDVQKRTDLDVEWRWDENGKKKDDRIPPQRIRRPSFKRANPIRSQLRKSPEPTQKKGFFKFREELMQNLANGEADSSHSIQNRDPIKPEPVSAEKLNDDIFNVIEILDSSSDESPKVFQTTSIKDKQTTPLTEKVPLQTTKHFAETVPAATASSRPKVDSCLWQDDSDLENLILQCTQQVEAEYKLETGNDNKSPAKPKINNPVTNLKEKDNGNDSCDELLSAIPIDELITMSKKSEKNQSKDTSGYSSSFSRHNSFPTQLSTYVMKIKPAVAFVKHNSMPIKDDGCPSKMVSPRFSISSESILSTGSNCDPAGRRCSAEEINRKRLEAIQRREANRKKNLMIEKKQFTQHPQINRFRK